MLTKCTSQKTIHMRPFRWIKEVRLEKSKVFEKELSWIKDDEIRAFVAKALDELPDYFYEVAASSTGKYHPSYALGEGGLVRHTKAAVAIAKDVLGLEMMDKYTRDERDIILAAIILHDGMKHGVGGSKYTVADHPVQMVDWLVGEMKCREELPEHATILCGAIASHMGQWNTDYKTKREIMPKPVGKLQNFVHLCDYLASRKYLEVNFEAINYTGDRV